VLYICVCYTYYVFVLNLNFNRCNELGLIERCIKIEGRHATNNELLMKHSQKIIDILKSTDDLQDNDVLLNMSSKFDAIYFHPVCKILTKSQFLGVIIFYLLIFVLYYLNLILLCLFFLFSLIICIDNYYF